MNIHKLFVAFALSWAGAMTGAANGLTLIENGTSHCAIVTGKDDRLSQAMTRRNNMAHGIPANALRVAADDLAGYLNKIAGIYDQARQTPVVTSAAETKSQHRILLGTAAIEAYDLQSEADTLPYPAYIYRVAGNDLLIFGSSSKGTANGVYGFLQDELGVRWFGPPEDFTVTPSMETVAIGALDKRVEPSFSGRFYMENYIEFPAYTWRRRMRIIESSDPHEPFNDAGSHNFWRIFPPNKYFDAHPEYYYMRSGQRRVYEPRHMNFNICYSNPDAVEIAGDAACAWFRANKYRHTFSLGINDTTAYCECPECAKLQPERNFRGWRVASDMYFHFVNEVARRVAKEFPDRYLGVIAYNDVTPPPLGAIEKNVHVVLVNDISEYYDPAYRAQDEELVREWEKKGISLGLYYYSSLAKLTPAYYARLLAGELKDKHSRGFISLHNESSPGWPWLGPMAYIEARLWWDVTLDVDKMLNEYFDSLFGAAAPHVRRLYELFEEIHMRPRGGGFLNEHNKFIQFRPYTAADLLEMKELLAKAHAAIPGLGFGWSHTERIEERRLAYVSSGLRMFMEMLEGYVAAQRLEERKGPADDIEAMRRLDDIERINEILRNHERLYRETIVNDPNQASGYRRDKCRPVREQWKTFLARAVGDALAELHLQNISDSKLDERTKAGIGQCVADYTSDEYRNVMFQFKTGALPVGENKLVNPGFEKVGGKHPFDGKHLDWMDTEADGWACWQAISGMGDFTISDKIKRTGEKAGVMRGIGKGCFIAVIPDIKTGEMWHARVYVKNTAHVTREDKPAVNLDVRWLDQKDQWTTQSVRLSDGTAELDEWICLELIVKAPPSAVSAVVMIHASSLQDGEEIFVDDVSFSRLSGI